MARAVEVVMRRAGKTASSSFSRIVFARDPLMRTLKHTVKQCQTVKQVKHHSPPEGEVIRGNLS